MTPADGTTTAISAASAPSNSNGSGSNSKTPPRHNYASPHSPIASIKRPRSSVLNANRSQSARSLSTATPRRSSSRSLTESETPASRSTVDDTETPSAVTLTPMHPVRPVHRNAEETTSKGKSTTADWVGRKVDALFSPVLRFLDQSENSKEETAELAATTTDTDTNPSTSSTTTATDSPESMNIVLSEDQGHECDAASAQSEDSLSIQGQIMPDQDSDEFNPWQFIQSLPPYSNVKHLAPPVSLPPKDSNAPSVTLVLDLDETLVHCSVDPVEGADLQFPVDFHGATYQVHVRLRPHLFAFLEACRGNFEVIVFTASQKIYASELLNRIDPEGKYIHHRLYRESCLAVDGNFLKDLNVLGRDLSKTILVDNSPHAFGYQVDNGIPIESWFDCPEDKELLKLERFLRQCQDAADVRPILRQKFQCQRLVDEAPPLFGMDGAYN